MIAAERRSTELGLVVLAALITTGAYALAALGRTADLPADLAPFLGIVIGLLVAAHVTNRFLAPNADGVLLPLAALLNGLGYAIIARLDTDLAGLQATWTLVSIGAYALTLLVVRRATDLARYKWTFAFIGMALLVMPLVPGLGFGNASARLWVSIGPINFQPGEFAKIALAIFFAAYLTERRELIAAGGWKLGPFNLPEPRHMGPLLVAWAASLLVMIGQKDLGSSLLFFALVVVLLWISTERASFLVFGAFLFATGAVLAWSQFSHVQDRVDVWLDPWAQAEGLGYQLVQAVYALAWGGTTGTGLGLGDPSRIPEVQNDFIFAAIGEELGLLGATAVIAAFVLMVGAGMRVAVQAERPFEKLLAAGLTTILGVQAFIILGGVTRVVPLTGVTLPFVSYGGSSLLSNYILLALLMRISDSVGRPTAGTARVGWRARRSQRRADRRAAAATASTAPSAPGGVPA
jgi:peptidoglycan glycosyltransferase